ncbi:MAG TPA: hypothetical protein VK804_12760 [Bradyrhizobium sp.]|jgi:hypothetical protein|uniref:hypothetical protein n=1 Tax=Bradyrhizobium sp. TaxID=376 RepID=UPI002C715A64|nr:hypothetical protein [Bradyrhizobium sp.]HTB01341.1 hypothetical protein [Bradyrhizobium sp.]
MADYYSLLSRAVAGLESNTDEMRQALYQRVRTILVDNLRNQKPPVPGAEIERERLVLEEAIQKVEQKSANPTSQSGTTAHDHQSELPARGKTPTADHKGRGGEISLSKNKAIVALYEDADAFSFMHHSAHLWLEEMIRDADDSRALPWVRSDLDVILKWLGVAHADELTAARHEQWALGFEQYLAEGRAPSTALAGAFEHFKSWAPQRAAKYAGIPLTDEVRGVIDRMLATDQELRNRAHAPEKIPSEASAIPRGAASNQPTAWSWTDATFWKKAGLIAVVVWCALIAILSAMSRDFRWFEYRGALGPASITAIAGLIIILALCAGVPWLLRPTSSTAADPTRTSEQAGARQRKHRQLNSHVTPIKAAPTLWRLNGCGVTLLGLFRDPDIVPLYFSVHTFTVFWIPVCPLGIYLVRATGDRSYQFHGTISVSNFGKLYPNGMLRLAASCLLESGIWIVAILLIFGLIALVFPHGHYGFRVRI